MPINVKTHKVFGKVQLLSFLQINYPKGYCATELTAIYNRDRSTISSHLVSLEKEGKIKSIKDGRNNYYYYNGEKNE